MRLLLVEDDPDIGALLRAWFEPEVEVTIRTRADDVTDVDIFANDVVIADHMMPGLVGCDLLHRVEKLRPEMRRVLWTAARNVVECPAAHVIVWKPATLTELMVAIRG